MRILYLVNKTTFVEKLSRVRFHGIEALSKIAQVTIWGIGWNGYMETETLEYNLCKYYGTNYWTQFDYIIAYKPCSMINFSNVKIKTCIRYNEMWDTVSTLQEINASKPDLIIGHHYNDVHDYTTNSVLWKNIHWCTKIIHIPHCAKNTIFYNRNLEKNIDILLCGSIGRHYPLRQRFCKIIEKMKSKYNCVEYKHPGYILTDAYTDNYLIDFAQAIARSKICLTCTSKYKYRLGKIVEITMCGSVLACDVPDQGPESEVYHEIMIVIEPTDTDQMIIDKLTYYLETDCELEKIRSNGEKWAREYTQEHYALQLLDVLNKSTKQCKVFVIGDELTLDNGKVKWICDVFKEEFVENSGLDIVTNIGDADIVWLLAPWSMRKFNKTILEKKFVITTVHHIDWDKYQSMIPYWDSVEHVTNKYHVICDKVFHDLKKITNKPIVVCNFWIDETKYFCCKSNVNTDIGTSTNTSTHLRKKYGIEPTDYVVGSFQKDTEGSDGMTPKLSKGPDIFLNIIKDMHKSKKYPNLLVVLTGWRRSYVMKGLDKIGVRYLYFELVETKVINELYNCLDLYIVSSRVEGGPRSIIECGIAKVPIISTDVGISSLILDDKSIYDWKDFKSWRKAVPNVEYAYEKAKTFEIKIYMKNFVDRVFLSKNT